MTTDALVPIHHDGGDSACTLELDINRVLQRELLELAAECKIPVNRYATEVLESFVAEKRLDKADRQKNRAWMC